MVGEALLRRKQVDYKRGDASCREVSGKRVEMFGLKTREVAARRLQHCLGDELVGGGREE